MKIGDVVNTKSLAVCIDSDVASAVLTYKIEDKKQAYVLLVLGTEEIAFDGQKLDLEKRMNELGWYRKEND